MQRTIRVLVLAAGAVAISFSSLAFAKDVRINLPKRDRTTPVQKLNRDGVEAISKHQYDKAKDLFYEAYLLDPDDPFTLNNLGYVAELAGDVERAQRFYELSAQNATEAVVDRSSSEMAEGKSLRSAVGDIPSGPMQINYINVQAVRLLSQDRAAEADVVLQRALSADPKNAFTLNNMGVTKELEGEAEQAIKFYDLSADQHSEQKVIVTLDSSARGRSVSEMAAESAKRLRRRLQGGESDQAKAARLNLQGVSALNRNELETARKLFREAYALDPYSAFSLNNIGYLAEMEGDQETAQFFYESARNAQSAGIRVGLATSKAAQGKKLFEIASISDQKVEDRMEAERQARRKKAEPILLRRRDNSVVQEPEAPAAAAPTQAPISQVPPTQKP